MITLKFVMLFCIISMLIEYGQASCQPWGFTYAADIFHASTYTMSPGKSSISIDKPVPYDPACSFVKVKQYKADYVKPTPPAPIEDGKDCVEQGVKRILTKTDGYTIEMCNALCRETAECVMFALYNVPDPDPESLKRCDLYREGCTFDSSLSFTWYNSYDPGTSDISVADISNTDGLGVVNGDKLEFTVSNVATVRDFETKLGYEFKGPKLLMSTVYCSTGINEKRISMNGGHTIKSCDELCNSTPNCAQFHFGLADSYAGRCDMYHKVDCLWVSDFDFDVYRPSKSQIPFEQFPPKFKIDVKASDPCLTATVTTPTTKELIVGRDPAGVLTDYKYDTFVQSSDPAGCPVQDVYYKDVETTQIIKKSPINTTLFQAQLGAFSAMITADCPLPLGHIEKIKYNTICGDGNALLVVLGQKSSQLACEAMCVESPLCAWFNFKPSSKNCNTKKHGCEATQKTEIGNHAYRPTGYVPSVCQNNAALACDKDQSAGCLNQLQYQRFLKVFLTGGHVSSPLDQISIFICGSETVSLVTADILTIDQWEQADANIPSTDLEAFFKIETLLTKPECGLNPVFELYSDVGLTTVWSDAKVVFDKVAKTITVDSSVPFAKKTAYYAVTSLGGVKLGKQINITIKTIDCAQIPLTTKHPEPAGYPVTYIYAETGKVIITKEVLLTWFESHPLCVIDPNAFTVTANPASGDTYNAIGQSWVKINEDKNFECILQWTVSATTTSVMQKINLNALVPVSSKTTPTVVVINMLSRACFSSLGKVHPADVYYGTNYVITPANTKIKILNPTPVTAPCSLDRIYQVSIADPKIADINMEETAVLAAPNSEFTIVDPSTERTFTFNYVYVWKDTTGVGGAPNYREDTVGPITVKVQASDPCQGETFAINQLVKAYPNDPASVEPTEISIIDMFDIKSSIDGCLTQTIFKKNLLEEKMEPYPASVTYPVTKSVSGKFKFFIGATSQTNLIILSTEVAVVICGTETITEKVATDHAFTYSAEMTTIVGQYKYQIEKSVLEAIWAVTATAADTDPECGKNMEYQAFTDVEMLTAWTDPLIILENGSITINTQNPFAIKTMYLQAKTIGGKTHLKKVTFVITDFDCKTQKIISPYMNRVVKFDIEMNSGGNHLFNGAKIREMFEYEIKSNYDRCVIDKYEVKQLWKYYTKTDKCACTDPSTNRISSTPGKTLEQCYQQCDDYIYSGPLQPLMAGPVAVTCEGWIPQTLGVFGQEMNWSDQQCINQCGITPGCVEVIMHYMTYFKNGCMALKQECDNYYIAEVGRVYGPQKCMMINHSKTGTCDMYNKDCTCEANDDHQKQVVGYRAAPNYATQVTIDATFETATILSTGWPATAGTYDIQFQASYQGVLKRKYIASVNVSLKCCVFEARLIGGDMMYSRAYVVTPQRNEILIPKSVAFHADAKFVGVRVVTKLDPTIWSTEFEVKADLSRDNYGFGVQFTEDSSGNIILKVININMVRELAASQFQFMYEDNSGIDGSKNVRYDLSDEVAISVQASHLCGSHQVKITIPNRVYGASSQTTPSQNFKLTDIWQIESTDPINCPIDMVYTKDLETDALTYNVATTITLPVLLTTPSKIETYVRPFTAFGQWQETTQVSMEICGLEKIVPVNADKRIIAWSFDGEDLTIPKKLYEAEFKVTTDVPLVDPKCGDTNYAIYADLLKIPSFDETIYLNIPFESSGECTCTTHPADFLEDKGDKSWAECYDECLNEPTCVIFLSHNATSCMIYTKDCPCTTHAYQQKYKVNRNYVESKEQGMVIFNTTTIADKKTVYLTVETFGLIRSGIYIDYTIQPWTCLNQTIKVNNTENFQINYHELSGKHKFNKTFYEQPEFMDTSNKRCPIAKYSLVDNVLLKNKTLDEKWIIMEDDGDITIDTDLLPGGNGTYYIDLKAQVLVFDGISDLTTLAINITRPFNCSDHQVVTEFPNGFSDDLKFDRMTGTKTIKKKKVYDEEKFFKTDSPHCEIDEFTVQDTYDSEVKVVSEGWVFMKGDDVGINTNKFPDVNATYYFELIGKVSKLDGTNASVAITFDIEAKEKESFVPEVDLPKKKPAFPDIKIEKPKVKPMVLEKIMRPRMEIKSSGVSDEVIIPLLETVVDQYLSDMRNPAFSVIEESQLEGAPPKVNESVIIEAQAKIDEDIKKNEKIEEQNAKEVAAMAEQVKKEEEQAKAEIEKQEKTKKEAANSPEAKKAIEKAAAVASQMMARIKEKKDGVQQLNDMEEKRKRKPKLAQSKMTRDGKMKFEFDHIMKVPEFLMKKRQLGDTQRHMVAYDELDLTRDILELDFIMKSDVDPSTIGYNIILHEWTASYINIELNFTNPMILSLGAEPDTVYVKIKNPALFISAETGKVLDLAGKVIMKQYLPRQIPKTVDLPKLIEDTYIQTDGMQGLIFLQISIQMFAKGSCENEILAAFYAIQYVTFFTWYTCRIPSSTELYLDEFRNLISFQAFNPETIASSIGIELSIKSMFGLMDGERMSGASDSTGMEYSSFSANISTYLAIILAFITIIAFLILCIIFQGIVKRYAYMYLGWMKRKTFFGGFIKGQTLGYLKVSVAVVVYFGTFDFGQFLDHYEIFLPKMTPFLLVVVWPFVVFVFLNYCKKHLGNPAIRGKFGQAYLGVNLKNGIWAIGKYPIFLLRRFIFVMIPVVYKQFPWHQIQLLIYMNLAHCAYIIHVNPIVQKEQQRMEVLNECIILILSYHMLLFTNFVGDPDTQYQLGYSFVSWLGFILFVNIGNMSRNQWLIYVSEKKKEQNQRAYENRFKENCVVEKLNYLIKCRGEIMVYQEMKQQYDNVFTNQITKPGVIVPLRLNPVIKRIKKRRIGLSTNNLSLINESANESHLCSNNSSYIQQNEIESGSSESEDDNSVNTRRNHKPDIFNNNAIKVGNNTLTLYNPDKKIQMEMEYQNSLEDQRAVSQSVQQLPGEILLNKQNNDVAKTVVDAKKNSSKNLKKSKKLKDNQINFKITQKAYSDKSQSENSSAKSSGKAKKEKKTGLQKAIDHIKNAVSFVNDNSGQKSMTKIGIVSTNLEPGKTVVEDHPSSDRHEEDQIEQSSFKVDQIGLQSNHNASFGDKKKKPIGDVFSQLLGNDKNLSKIIISQEKLIITFQEKLNKMKEEQLNLPKPRFVSSRGQTSSLSGQKVQFNTAHLDLFKVEE